MAARGKKLNTVLSGDQLESGLALIANMIMTQEDVDSGVKSRIFLQGRHRLSPDYLPPHHDFEAFVLRVIYAMEREGVPATFDNILVRARMEQKYTATAIDQLRGLLLKASADRDVGGLAFGIGDWIEQNRMLAAAQKAVERLTMSIGTPTDAYAEVMRLLAEVRPNSENITTKTGTELMEDWMKNQDARKESQAAGATLGPTFPWASLRAKIPNLKIGDLTTIAAKSKDGKTTVGINIAEWNAYGNLLQEIPEGEERQANYYDVAYFHLETSGMSLQDRIVSKHVMVKPGVLRMPELFDHRAADGLGGKVNTLRRRIAQAEKSRGKIHYVHCPGIGPAALEQRIAELKLEAETRGRELLVLIDYYTEIDWSELSDHETAGNNALANFLKRVAEQNSTRCYMIAFAQFNIDSDYASKTTAWNGSKIVMRSQNYIVLERDDATSDEPIMRSDGTQLRDGVENLLFWHKAGERSSLATFRVKRSNDDEAGPAQVRFVNGYFRIVDIQGG